jgi:N-methylhydantoinase A
MRISADVGGTFTDIIALDDQTGQLTLTKVETVPENPALGVQQGIRKAGVPLDQVDFFIHGTTLGLNALLTRAPVRVAIVTTQGFRDVYELGRTSRDPMYDFKYRKPRSLVPRWLAFEVAERLDYQGRVLTAFDQAGAQDLARHLRELGVQSVAVCFLHSYANPDHELQMERVLRVNCPEMPVTLSHRLFREYREYERTSTAVIDAYIKPLVRTYLEKLDGELRAAGFQGGFLLTRSGGGAMTVAFAKEQPVHLLLSGPAGGVIGASYLSELIGHKNLVTIDMGGTSLDASLIVDGQIQVDNEFQFQTWPVAVPIIDINTIGAGGGSISWIDDGGHLQVGPQSAGALPGPACYSKGGTQATFTDAALLIGYLNAANFLGGEIKINPDLARQAVQKLAEPLGLALHQTAAGIVRITEVKIAGAVREISIERGYHPKDFALLAYGGGGGFLATRVARELGIPTVIIPPGPANFSALGMLMVDVVHDLSQTYVVPLPRLDAATLNGNLALLLADGTRALEHDEFPPERQRFQFSVDLRYQGQEHTVNVPLSLAGLEAADLPALIGDFNREHERQYGHSMDDVVELVTLRLRAIGLLPRPSLPTVARGTMDAAAAHCGQRETYQADTGTFVSYPLYSRGRLLANNQIIGPAIVEEPSSTTIIHAGDVLTVGNHGELVIDCR